MIFYAAYDLIDRQTYIHTIINNLYTSSVHPTDNRTDRQTDRKTKGKKEIRTYTHVDRGGEFISWSRQVMPRGYPCGHENTILLNDIGIQLEVTGWKGLWF